MHVFMGIAGGLVVGFVAGLIYSGKVKAAIKSLEITIQTRLSGIETAIKKPFVHAELVEGATIKTQEEYVEEIAAKVLTKLKAAEQTAKI